MDGGPDQHQSQLGASPAASPTTNAREIPSEGDSTQWANNKVGTLCGGINLGGVVTLVWMQFGDCPERQVVHKMNQRLRKSSAWSRLMRPRPVKLILMAGALLSLSLSAVALTGSVASAGNGGGFPMAFNPETPQSGLNTFTNPPTILNPQCPNGLAGTPGSDPATKVLNPALNTPASFAVGGQVHYIYMDDPHGAASGFDIQDCEVTFPPSFFTSADFDPTTGVLINPAFTKSVLDKNGTQIDGASLTGILSAEGQIFYSWTVQPVPTGTWICNFARDIDTDHGGGGNRKVTPTCFQVGLPPVFPTVSVGYADGEHGTPATPGSPWPPTDGTSATLAFAGCPAPTQPGSQDYISSCPAATGSPGQPMTYNGDYDGGAIDLHNSTSTGITLQSVTVQLDAGTALSANCYFDIWPHNTMVVPANGDLVLAQTAQSTAVCGTADSDYNFDTSDSQITECVTNTIHPTVTVTLLGGASETFTDTTNVLTSGGDDPGSCGASGAKNEARPWTPIS